MGEEGQEVPNFVRLVEYISGTPIERYVIISKDTTREDALKTPNLNISVVATSQSRRIANNTVKNSMNILVKLVIENKGPPSFKGNLTDIEVFAGKTAERKFEIQDLFDNTELNKDVPSMTITLREARSFSKFDEKNLILKVFPDKNLPTKDYPVEIEVTDNNPAKSQTTKQTFTIKVINNQTKPVINVTHEQIQALPNKTSKAGKKIDPVPLTARISSISQFGVVEITFNQEFEVS